MYRTEDEKRADTKLGEAVLFLLRKEAPVNEIMLLLRLQQMLMTEKENAAGRVPDRTDDSGRAGTAAPGDAVKH